MPNNNGLSGLFEVMLLLVIFGGIVWLAYFATKRIALVKQGGIKNKNLQIVEVLGIGPQQFVYILKVGTDYHLVMTAKEKVTYCGKIEQDTLNLEVMEAKHFNDYLNQFISKKNEEEPKA